MSQSSAAIVGDAFKSSGGRWDMEVCLLNVTVRNGVLVRSGELMVLVNSFRLTAASEHVVSIPLQDGV